MQTNNLSENHLQLPVEVWSKPEVKVISVKEDTRGTGSSGSDGGGFSATCDC